MVILFLDAQGIFLLLLLITFVLLIIIQHTHMQQ